LVSDKTCPLGFIAQNTDYDWDPWSLALCYNPRTGITTGLLCAEEKKQIDVNAIIDELKAKDSPSTHPILLPVIMFDRLLQSSMSHYTNLHRSIWALEEELQHVECTGCTDEDLKYHNWSQRLNYLKKQQASRDGRHQFWRQFHHELLEVMRKVAQETHLKNLETEHLELEQRIHTISVKFLSLEGRDINSNRRIDAQLKLVNSPFPPLKENLLTQNSKLYHIIQQNESRSQCHIAAAMSKDSAEVAFLTWLGALFLPASVVAASLPHTFSFHMLTPYTVFVRNPVYQHKL
jgi:hypothetical protein